MNRAWAGKRWWGALMVVGTLSFGAGCTRNNDDVETVHIEPVPPEDAGTPDNGGGGTDGGTVTDGGTGGKPDGGTGGKPDGGTGGKPDGGTGGTTDGGTGGTTDGGTGGTTDGGTGGTTDGGTGTGGGGTGGTDGGTGGMDGGTGTGGGGGGGGGGSTGGGTIVFPPSSGWAFYGPQHGLPGKVYGVSSDKGGNIWVAGGDDGLFLLRPGASRFERFTVADGLSGYTDANGTHGYKVISVAGGPAGVVIVGYKGLGDSDDDPEYMVKSGDADRVTLAAGGITASHYDISTGPGVDSHYPQGRDKIRHVYRLIYDHRTGNVWFGGNHGVALWEARSGKIFEHQHAAINGYDDKNHYTLLSGDWSIALDASGDLWTGGAHRTVKMPYATGRGGFWAEPTPKDGLDLWPDAVKADAYPNQRTDDFVQDMAITRDGRVWIGSIPNSLAVVSSSGIGYIRDGMVDRKITSLEADPADDSVWVGHIYGGVTRIKDGNLIHYDFRVFGPKVIEGTVPDIQSDSFEGRRRILVAFEEGAIGIYTGN